MRRSTTRTRWSAVAAAPVGLLVSGVLVWQASSAAFTATTDNAGNALSAGSVVLTDDDAGVALFSPTKGDDDLVPGDTRSECIDVTYAGTAAATIKFYGRPTGSSSSDLSSFVDIEVDQVVLDEPDCATATKVADVYGPVSLATLVTINHTFATGSGTWLPGGAEPETRRFRLTYTMLDFNQAQGRQTTVSFVWEARSRVA